MKNESFCNAFDDVVTNSLANMMHSEPSFLSSQYIMSSAAAELGCGGVASSASSL